MILFVWKGQLLVLQEMQEVNIKTKEQPNGMMLATSFFQKEKEIITHWQHIYIHKAINLHKN